jgi:hypothetical protein
MPGLHLQHAAEDELPSSKCRLQSDSTFFAQSISLAGRFTASITAHKSCQHVVTVVVVVPSSTTPDISTMSCDYLSNPCWHQVL